MLDVGFKYLLNDVYIYKYVLYMSCHNITKQKQILYRKLLICFSIDYILYCSRIIPGKNKAFPWLTDFIQTLAPIWMKSSGLPMT